MRLLFQYVWFVKVCLTGWSAYRSCMAEYSNPIICGMSVSYFLILFLATLCSLRTLRTPRQLDGLEADYLRRLEEGLKHDLQNEKPE